jgi:hypothetical protein
VKISLLVSEAKNHRDALRVRMVHENGATPLLTYLLTPQHSDQPIWSSAARREPVQIVAMNEAEARVRASLRYGQRRGLHAITSPDDPWLDPKWASARVVAEADSRVPLLPAPEEWPDDESRAA